MTKNEYLSQLMNELKKNNIVDADEIVDEYDQHFDFKLEDGFSEEEISAKLCNPVELALQFNSNTGTKKAFGRKVITIIGLCFANVFVGIFFALIFIWEAFMAVFSLASATGAVCLIGGFNVYSLIPSMPYWCGAVFGISVAALAVLAATGSIYFAAFARQLVRAYSRFHHNAIVSASGKAVLPYIAIHPQFPTKTKRRIRTVALLSLAAFAACFVAGMIVSMFSAGGLGFWHIWGWFVK